MGTHISRVKSVDLDTWTDEQLQSILSWGNARANKYWEAKLAAGHVPSEAKIENFIRTKYELKRWVMDGPIPDPSTLDVDGDDNVPLSIVKEKQTVDRKESIRKASVGKSAAPLADLIGADPIPQRASTAGPTATRVPQKAEPAPPKATSTKDSLLGLDFLGTEVATPPRPASTSSNPGLAGQSRPDLKQSILSLYATAPKQQVQPQISHAPSGAFGGLGSPNMPQAQQQPLAGGGMIDAFSSLSFASTPPVKSPQASAFSNVGNLSSNRSAPQTSSNAFSNLSGGGFFDAKPTPATASHQQNPSFGSSGFGAFSTTTTTAAAPKPAPVPAPASAALGDLFDFSTPAQAPAVVNNPPPMAPVGSVFHLSNPPKPSPPAPTPAAVPLASSGANWASSSSDVWGGNAWSTDTTATKTQEASKAPASDFGWGNTSSSLATTSIVPGASGGFSPTPKVTADEEFGGWTTGTTTSPAGASKPAGAATGSDDLFSNVWQ